MQSEGDDSDHLRISIVDGEEYSLPVRPCIVRACGFGPYFTMGEPNDVSMGQQSAETLLTGPWWRPHNELLSHSFDLQGRNDKSIRGGIVIRCWLESDARPFVSAAYVAERYHRLNLPLGTRVGEFFEAYDGSGKMYFRDRK